MSNYIFVDWFLKITDEVTPTHYTDSRCTGARRPQTAAEVTHLDTAYFILPSLFLMNIHNCAYHANVIMTNWQSCVTEYIKMVMGTLIMALPTQLKTNYLFIKKKNMLT